MADSVDVLVVGAGLMGAASAWSLARRDRSVAVVEQYEPGHRNGSSHGSARIVRRAYGDALYTQLTGRAFELWRELETESGEQVLRFYGGLDFGVERPVADIAWFLADANVAHEVLPAAEAEQRWPGMRFDGDVVFHEQAGTVDAALAVETMLASATASGAAVTYSRAVAALEPSESGVVATFADGSSVAARVAVVAAGAWVAGLLDGLVRLPPLRVRELTVCHFPRRDQAAPPWPSVIHKGSGSAAYHLAGGRDGGPGDDRKIGLHDLGPVFGSGNERSGRPDGASLDALVEYARDWLPGLEPTPRGVANCLYTITPTEDFILDRVGPIVVCSPCSGHGAKFAPLIGELVAGLVDGSGDVPERFRLAAHATGRVGSVSL